MKGEGLHRQVLGDDNVGGVRGMETDSSHDGDEHVFLLVERSRVKGDFTAKHPDALVGQDLCHSRTGRVSQKLCDIGENNDTRLTIGEEHVDESSSKDEQGTDNIGTERRRRHVRVVSVLDNSSDLGVWRVLSHQYRLELHLTNELRVLVSNRLDVGDAEELLDLDHDGVGEVLIILMELFDLFHDLEVNLRCRQTVKGTHRKGVGKGQLGDLGFRIFQIINGDLHTPDD
jgi:hypothetical protein